METAGVCAEATGTAAIGAATEKTRTIAATVGVRISVSFTRNPSQREDAMDAGDGGRCRAPSARRDGGHRAHATWALDLAADSGVAAASAPSSRGSKSSTWISSMTLRSYSRNAAASVSDTMPAALREDRKSTRLNSSHRCISYAVFCLKKKKIHNRTVGGSK